MKNLIDRLKRTSDYYIGVYFYESKEAVNVEMLLRAFEEIEKRLERLESAERRSFKI